MASASHHLRQWRHNRAFLALITADFTDWFITATFYTALHAVDALLQVDNVRRLTSHQSRNALLRETKRYEAIWKHYRPLYDLSQSVRYLADPETWVPIREVERQILIRHLYPIEQSVRKLFSDRAGFTVADIPSEKIVLRL